MVRSFLPLALIFLLFVILRLPVLYSQPGGQDEDFYAVPGLTILQTGLPQLPHAPARNTESICFHADSVFYSEPPLYFYVQALSYAFLPDVYGTARLTSLCSGLVAAFIIYLLCRNATGSVSAATWSAGLFVFSRWFYFPVASARPDILCSAFGFAGIALMLKWHATRQPKWLIGTGVMIGLGGMTHPFAFVYAVQLAVWAMVAGRGWKRMLYPAVLALTAILVTGLWLPLIWLHPEIFATQFRNQFLAEQHDSLLYRALMPWTSIAYHYLGPLGLLKHVRYWQIFLVFVPSVACLLQSIRRKTPVHHFSVLGLTSVYLLCVLVGSHHRVIGYWSYSAGLMFICTGYSVDVIIRRLMSLSGIPVAKRRLIATTFGLLLCATLIPGAGLKTLYVTMRHWNDINYRAPQFANSLIASLPDDAVFIVDTAFTLDFLSHGRQTLLSQNTPFYFLASEQHFDYLIVSRSGTDTGIASQLPVRLVGTRGIKEDLFACYCEIYIRDESHQE